MARSYGLGLVCFALVAAAASATQFRVGGQRGWSVPDASAEPYNAWAGRMRFHIGDQLLFVYPKETDSVLLVEQGAYNACNTTSYANRFDDGSTVFTFDRSGPFFFISGNEASCRANEKLTVVVLSDHTAPAVSPTPSSMPPPSAAPMPPPSGSPMPPPSAAPMPPPSGAPMPSPSSSPPSAAPMPAPAATPGSAPSPMASAPGPAPTATPGSPPSPEALAPSPSSSPGTPGGVPQPPSASTSPPGAEGPSSTTPGSGAATMAAGLASALAAFIGYAMLAI